MTMAELWTNNSLAFASGRDNWSSSLHILFVHWSTLAWNDNCQVSPPYFPVESAMLCTRIPSILPTSPLLSNPSSMQSLIVSCALAL